MKNTQHYVPGLIRDTIIKVEGDQVKIVQIDADDTAPYHTIVLDTDNLGKVAGILSQIIESDRVPSKAKVVSGTTKQEEK